MKTIKVRINLKDGGNNIYEVLGIYENFKHEGKYYLAMQRIKDAGWKMIPMDIIEEYEIIKK